MSNSLNIVGWLLFEILPNGNVSTATFPTRGLCEDGASIALTGRTVTEEKIYQEKRKEEQRKMDQEWRERQAWKSILKCGYTPCAREPNQTSTTGSVGLPANTSYNCVNRGNGIYCEYSDSLPGRDYEVGQSSFVISQVSVKDARCFPIPQE